jgi:ABC-type Zn uptake system ZnuABC Zn-binding protein ZnuA
MHLPFLRPLLACLGMAAAQAPAQDVEPLRICATTADLGSLCRQVGGARVEVTVFAHPGDDPHSLEARPSMVRKLHDAHALVLTGLQLEAGWLPVLLNQSRNGRVLRGAAGHIDASTAIRPLAVPAGVVERSQGDVHALGNPHYLLDPIAGLEVARLLAARFAALRPEDAERFAANFEAFRAELAAALVGPKLAAKYDAEKLAVLAEAGRLDSFLAEQGDAEALGGWLAAARPLRGAKFAGDHDLYPSLARRFGLVEVALLESLPGVPPSTRHLADVIRRMRQDKVQLLLSAPYFDRRHAELVARQTGARIAALAHQCGARPSTPSYLELIDYNVAQLVAAMAAATAGAR